MIHPLRFITLALLALLLATPAVAANPPIPNPPELNARAYLLVDHQSGRILAEKGSDMRVEPASITKLMTVYVAFQELRQGHLRLGQLATVSRKAYKMPGSRMFLELGTSVSVEELLYGIIVQSGNDASVVLAEHIAGSEDNFAEIMNQYAQVLGMTNTYYMNSTGLPDPNHYTTAQDIVKLSRELIREFPEYYAWFGEEEYTYNKINQQNRNKLLWRDPSVDGLKTGHTKAAGYCLAASAKRDDMRLLAVVLGTRSDSARMSAIQSLLNYGFRFYQTKRFLSKGETLKNQRIWKGAVETVPIGLTDDVYVTLPRGRDDAVQYETQLHGQLTAPLETLTEIGTLNVQLEGETIGQYPLVTLQTVDTGNLWDQLWDNLLLMFNDES